MSEDRNDTAIPADRDPRGRFRPGNPGKPKGARARATLAVAQMLDGSAKRITQVAIDKALAGDPVALRLCIERLAPIRRESPITADLPPLSGAGDVVAFLAAIVEQVGAGRLTVGEGERLAKMAGELARVAELSDFDARLRALEQSHGQS